MENASIDKNLQVTISYKAILKTALPISLSILVPQINFITNNIFLGQLSVQALAVAGITGVYYLVFAVLGFGLNNGFQMVVARRAGENRPEEIGNLFNQGAFIALAFAAAGIIITYFIAPAILRLSLSEPQHVQMAEGFLYIRIWGLPLLYIFHIRNGVLIGTNQSKLLIIGAIAETVANILLDYGFIFGHFGLPQLGFNGAAVASVISEGIGLAAVAFVMNATKINHRFQLLRNIRFDKDAAKLILVRSAPLMLQFVISVSSWEFFYILIEHHGERALAISNCMRNIFGLFGCVTWAFAATTSTMVSNVIGQNLQHRVKELIYKILRLSVGFALIIFILLNISPAFLLQAYNQGDAFITEAIPVVRVVSAALIIMSVSVVWLNSVTGTGNTRINLQIEILAIILYCIYAYYILQKLNYPITWGWAAEWLYWLTILIPSFFYIQNGKWKNKRF